MTDQVKCDIQNTRISQLEGAVNMLAKQHGEVTKELTKVVTKLDTYFSRVDEHDRALRGYDGTPGVISRLDGFAEFIEEFKAAWRGNEAEPGLKTAMIIMKDKMVNQDDQRKWFSRLVIGLVATQVALFLAEKFVK